MEKDKNSFLKKVLIGIGIALPICIILLLVPYIIPEKQEKVKILFVNNTDSPYYQFGCEMKFDNEKSVWYGFNKNAGFMRNDLKPFEVGEQTSVQVKEECYNYEETPKYVDLNIWINMTDNSDKEQAADISIKDTVRVPVKENEYNVVSITGNEKDGYYAEYTGTTSDANPTRASQTCTFQ